MPDLIVRAATGSGPAAAPHDAGRPDVPAIATTGAELLRVTMRMPIHDLLGVLRESGLTDGSRCVWCHADGAWATSAVHWACRDCGHRGTIVELAWAAACTPRTLQRALALAAVVGTRGEGPADVAEVTAGAEGGQRA